MIANPGGKLDVSLSGTTSEVKANLYWGKNTETKVSMNRVIRRIRLRGTGGITAVNIKLVDRDHVVANGMTYASIPEEYIVAEWAAVPVTASSTADFLDDELTSLPRCAGSLAIVVDVTAGSAWTIVGYIDVGT